MEVRRSIDSLCQGLRVVGERLCQLVDWLIHLICVPRGQASIGTHTGFGPEDRSEDRFDGFDSILALGRCLCAVGEILCQWPCLLFCSVCLPSGRVSIRNTTTLAQRMDSLCQDHWVVFDSTVHWVRLLICLITVPRGRSGRGRPTGVGIEEEELVRFRTRFSLDSSRSNITVPYASL